MNTMTKAQVSQPTVTLVEPLPGLGEHVNFQFHPLDELGAIYSMRVDGDDSRLLILAAAPVFHPDYTPVLDDDTCNELSLTNADDAAVFLVVNASETLANSTVNLLAPLIVNSANHRAKQIVLTGPDSDLRVPLITPSDEVPEQPTK